MRYPQCSKFKAVVSPEAHQNRREGRPSPLEREGAWLQSATTSNDTMQRERRISLTNPTVPMGHAVQVRSQFRPLNHTGEERPTSSAGGGDRAHTSTRLPSATRPIHTVQRDPQNDRTNQTVHMGQSAEVSKQPVQFTISHKGLKKKHHNHNRATALSNSGVQDKAPPVYKPTAQFWLKHRVPSRERYTPERGSVLHTSFLLQTQDMFHVAQKHLSPIDLQHCLKSIRKEIKKHYDIHNVKRFVYRGNICQICPNCAKEDCAWNYSCTTCHFPQPICLLKLKRQILTTDSVTPCAGCRKCRILRKQCKHKDDKRRPCGVCQTAPKLPGSIQQRTHCMSHCHFRFSAWDKQQSSAVSRLRNDYPNKCTLCNQGHNVVVCHHSRVFGLLNKVAKKRREARLAKKRREARLAKAAVNIQPVLKFHSEADTNTLPHFKSGTKKQAWTYHTMH